MARGTQHRPRSAAAESPGRASSGSRRSHAPSARRSQSAQRTDSAASARSTATPRGGSTRSVATSSRRAAPARGAGRTALFGRLLRGPLGRLLAVAVGAGMLAGGAYAAAADTSIFALQRFAVSGASPALAAQVRAALSPELGRSLLRVSGAQVDAVAATLPDVVSLRFVRSFPHTLQIDVVPERPALLIRRGTASFLVSARGRVMARVAAPGDSLLPRLWVGRGTLLSVGQTLTTHNGLLAAVAAAGLSPGLIPGGVRFVTVSGTDVTLLMRSGFQIRLGDIGQLQLKLAIAQRIVAYLGSAITGDSYLDVSVPARPVVGSTNSQLSTQSLG